MTRPSSGVLRAACQGCGDWASIENDDDPAWWLLKHACDQGPGPYQQSP